tara:strand:- start:1914 stop:2054 length:141 start_codon:yes stop_codon:yes gene_type:complete
MSTTSAKQRYETFTEWHNWAKSKYPNFRAASKKKTTPKPIWSLFDE